MLSSSPSACAHIRRAFSLTEMLVVIAILGLLAALLFPVFQGVRTSARTATCQNNLRQIGIALQLYTTDYRGLYPSIVAHPANCTWTNNIAPYVKSESIFTCPEAPNLFFKNGCLASETQGDITLAFDGGYSLNVPDSARSPQMSQRQIRQPTEMILVVDGDGHYTSVGPGTGTIPMERIDTMGIYLRHRGGINATFADGHVKWLSQEKATRRRSWSLSGRD